MASLSVQDIAQFRHCDMHFLTLPIPFSLYCWMCVLAEKCYMTYRLHVILLWNDSLATLWGSVLSSWNDVLYVYMFCRASSLHSIRVSCSVLSEFYPHSLTAELSYIRIKRDIQKVRARPPLLNQGLFSYKCVCNTLARQFGNMLFWTSARCRRSLV